MPPTSAKHKALLATAHPTSYNIHRAYSVVLDHPISNVCATLAHGHNMEHVVRLSDICTEFELFDSDIVVTPDSAPLAESRVRTEPASAVEGGLPRQYFRFKETVPLVFGLAHTTVELVGTQTWDENAKVVLYETVADQGIVMRKLRAFKEIEEDGKKKTSVIETIQGSCPMWMKLIVQRAVETSHTCVDCSVRSFLDNILHDIRRVGHIWRNTTPFFDACDSFGEGKTCQRIDRSLRPSVV